jgi:hypothetical protein
MFNGYAKIVVFLTMLLCEVLISQNAWIPQNSAVNSDLNSVHAVDANIVYTVNQSGGILKTINGGNNWVA